MKKGEREEQMGGSDIGEAGVRLIADRARCAGHARCAAVAPELFELDPEGYIGFDEKAVPAGLEASARRGARACPERALVLVGDEPA